MIGTTTVTVLRKTSGVDRYGDSHPSGEATRVDVRGCALAPRFSNDLSEPGRQGVIIGITLYAPTSAPITATDQIEWAGTVYDIDGGIGLWRSPYSRIDGVEVALRRAEG